ncbi:MAG: hypothetical protein IKQ36_07225 [Clostridia bacterium]|nr:hypothetical protein [Clostridia bacterium]
MAGNTQLKEFELPLDLKRPCGKRDIEVVDGDTGNVLAISLTDDGEAVSVSGLRVMAVFSSARGVSVQDSEDGSVTLDGSNITIALAPSSFAPGLVECELQLYSSTADRSSGMGSEDVLVTTAKFNFRCRAAMLNDDAIHAMPQLPTLSEFLAEVEAAEAARQAAEAERAAAEAERIIAEALRGAALEEHIAYAGVGIKAVNSAPTGADGDSVGRVYVVRNGNAAYICTDMAISAGEPSFVWKKLAFDNPWTDLKTLSLSSDVSGFTLDSDSSGAPFEWDELRLVLVGTMKNSTIAHISVNGSSNAVKDSNFMLKDVAVPADNMCIVNLRRMEEGFALYERECGSTDASTAFATVRTPQKAFLKLGNNAKYSAVTISAGTDAGRFGSGMTIRLQGRNVG